MNFEKLHTLADAEETEDDDSQIAQSFAGSEGVPEGSRGKGMCYTTRVDEIEAYGAAGSFELPKRCERCKRAKKGAQYCFDAVQGSCHAVMG